MLFHHFVSVCGLSHGVRYPSAKVLVASYGLIEIHTSYMTFRRLTGEGQRDFSGGGRSIDILCPFPYISVLVYKSDS